MKQSGNPFLQCIPTYDARGTTWYFDIFSAHSLKCYDMSNLLLHPSITDPSVNKECIDLLTNSKFPKAVKYALNDQLNSHNIYDSKHQQCRKVLTNSTSSNSYPLACATHCGLKAENYYFDLLQTLLGALEEFPKDKKNWVITDHTDGDGEVRKEKRRMYEKNLHAKLTSKLKSLLYLLCTNLHMNIFILVCLFIPTKVLMENKQVCSVQIFIS